MPVTTGSVPNQFDKTIDKMFYSQYKDWATEYTNFYQSVPAAPGSSMQKAELRGLGVLQTKPQGSGISLDRVEDGSKKSISYVTYALGVQFTKEAMDDDLFGKLSQVAANLARNAKITQELIAASHLVNSFGTSTAWDSAALCAAHTNSRAGTSISNLATAALSSTSLQAAFDAYDQMIGSDDLPMMMNPNKLIVSGTNRAIAHDILTSLGRVWDFAFADMNRGAIEAGTTKGYPAAESQNLLKPGNLVNSWNYYNWHFLKAVGSTYDADDWWLLADDPDKQCLNAIWKNPIETSNWFDNQTKSKIFDVTMRLAIDSFDWRYIYGSNVA